MPTAWFICPYKRVVGASIPTRYCAMDDFTPQIYAEGGAWSETEILGDQAIVKVRASAPTIAAIVGAGVGFQRLPKDALDASLADLTAGQKNALKAWLTAAGYTAQELQQALGSDLAQRTLRDVLVFATRRRLKPRYDQPTDKIVLDGEAQTCTPISQVDAAV